MSTQSSAVTARRQVGAARPRWRAPAGDLSSWLAERRRLQYPGDGRG